MPTFKHKDTGALASLTDRAVTAYPAGTWTKVADESVEEERARIRLQQERDKVNSDPEPVATPDPEVTGVLPESSAAEPEPETLAEFAGPTEGEVTNG